MFTADMFGAWGSHMQAKDDWIGVDMIHSWGFGMPSYLAISSSTSL